MGGGRCVRDVEGLRRYGPQSCGDVEVTCPHLFGAWRTGTADWATTVGDGPRHGPVVGDVCELFGGGCARQLCSAEPFARRCCSIGRVLWSSCEWRCRGPEVVSTESEENETEIPSVCPHLVVETCDGTAVDWVDTVRRHTSSRIQFVSRI